MKKFADIIDFDNSHEAGDYIESNDKYFKYRNIQFEYITIIDDIFVLTYENGNKTHPLQKPNEKKNIIFTDCNFEKLVFNGSCKHNFLFNNCNFNEVLFEDIFDGENKIEYIIFKNSTFNDITIKNSSFNGRLYINPRHQSDVNDHVCNIKNLTISDSIFNKNFKLHNCEIERVHLNNADFEKNADFYLTKFLQNQVIEFNGINFRGLALFGETVFTSKVVFNYVTFEKLTHFRQATFKAGLDLEKANIQSEMNFFGAKELDSKNSIANISQETYRIIKYNFSKIGNQIEANRYFALELSKRKEQLHVDKNPLDWFVFYFHEKSSNFSRDWWLSLKWIGCVGLITIYFIHFDIVKDLFFHPNHFKEVYITKFFDEFFKYMSHLQIPANNQ